MVAPPAAFPVHSSQCLWRKDVVEYSPSHLVSAPAPAQRAITKPIQNDQSHVIHFHHSWHTRPHSPFTHWLICFKMLMYNQVRKQYSWWSFVHMSLTTFCTHPHNGSAQEFVHKVTVHRIFVGYKKKKKIIESGKKYILYNIKYLSYSKSPWQSCHTEWAKESNIIL